MKTVNLKTATLETIDAFINERQPRARARTLSCIDAIAAGNLADNHPAVQLIPKKMRRGITVYYQPANKLPNCYQYLAQSTYLRLIWRGDWWQLWDAGRARNNESKRDELAITLTAESERAALERFSGLYNVAYPMPRAMGEG